MNKDKLTRKIKNSLCKISCMILIISLVSCGNQNISSPSDTDNKLNIVTTTTMIYDLVSQIAGDNVNITGLMGVGIDPHMYTASAGDVIKMESSDVVIYNGIHLEGQMGEVFDALDSMEKNVICLEDAIDQSDLIYNDDNVGSTYDPHIWFDVSLWSECAVYVANSLAYIDPDNAELYLENLQIYTAKLQELQEYILDEISQIDESKRVLITAHDAFRYFSNAYGFQVIGLQGISTDSEASTSDISELANFIATNQIKAIFVESSISTKSIEALQAAVKSKGFEVDIGGELYSDSLSDECDYILTVKSNIDTIVKALME